MNTSIKRATIPIGKCAAMMGALGFATLANLPVPTLASGVAQGVPAAWHGEGRWAWHDGRWGWWWIDAAGVWTWYAYNPYYPGYLGYPSYYGYPAPYPYPPRELPPSFSNMPAPQQYWYYCDSAKSYYPNVPTCPTGWRAVPRTPDAPGATPAPPPGTQSR